MNNGRVYAAAAYILWGLLPLYWKLLASVPPLEILAHRTFGALVFIAVLLTADRRRRQSAGSSITLKLISGHLPAALLLSINWLTFIWAVNSGYVLEVSLGYFANPIVTVLLGVVVLHEKMRPARWAAVIIAFGGVVYLTAAYGRFPWVALALAVSFAVYGLLRKRARLGSLEGLFAETLLMSVPALLYILFVEISGRGSFFQSGASTALLLLSTGAATGLPLLLFSKAARRIDLSQIGFYQYIAPVFHFILGAVVFGEPLSRQRLTGFIIIWAALAVYIADTIIARSRPPAAQRPVP